PGVVTVGIRGTGQLRARILGSVVVPVHVPVQAPARVIEDPVHGQARSGRGGEKRRASETVRIGLADNQVPVAAENTHVVTVLVERMLPAPLSDDAQKNLFARMHVRIAVVGLMGILNSVVGILV